MCGILGYLSKGEISPPRAEFERAIDIMTHRGPDQRGVWVSSEAGLGFRRLSIMDLSNGSQPMGNEDGSLQLVFNGEIYHFQQLRKDLESRGHIFRTQSDSETILHLFEEKGEDCVQDLEGMFAFAIYHVREQKLFLARDRFGKKPLVYAETPQGFFFASEIPPLFKLASLSRRANLEGIHSYLALQYLPSDQTAWKAIRRLPPAHHLWVDRHQVYQPKRYWRLSWKINHDLDESSALEQLRPLVAESVRKRLVADVPLGAFLSGGVDSSIMVAAMTQLTNKVKTFTIRFQDRRFDESSYARQAANVLGTDHHEMEVQPDSLDGMNHLIGILGEPFADHSLIPTWLLSRFTRQQVTVALSGDGGDELFAGYKRYLYLQQAEILDRWGLRAVRLLMSRGSFAIEQLLNPKRRKLKWPRSALDRILQVAPWNRPLRLLETWPRDLQIGLWQKSMPSSSGDWIHSIEEHHASADSLSRWQALDTETYLCDDILRKVDLASMASSLECRCPLLDRTLAEFAVTIPASLKIQQGTGKHLLRRLFPKQLSQEFFDRPKKGFSMPIGHWMRNQWKPAIEESIESSWENGMENMFSKAVLRRIWNEHLQEQEDHSHRLWSWWVLFQWNRKFQPEW